MKTHLRKEVLAAALALCVSVFTGCSKNETEPVSLDTSTSSTSSEKDETSTAGSTPASSSSTESAVSSAEPANKAVSQPESKPEGTTASEPESKPESTTTITSEPVTPTPDPEPAPEWTEEPASGAYYINTDYVNAREKALVGAKAVGTFSLNDQVTVVAKTSTGYYKMLNGYFIHGDYLSTTKTEAQKPATSVPFVPTEPTDPSKPKHGDTKYVPDEGLIMYDETLGRWAHDGDTKVENGITYRWNAAFGMWGKVTTGHEIRPTPEQEKWDAEHYDEYGNRLF